MQITLGDLLVRMQQAQQRMSAKNPHRALFWQCEQVMTQMGRQLAALTTPALGASEPSPAQVGHGEDAPPAV